MLSEHLERVVKTYHSRRTYEWGVRAMTAAGWRVESIEAGSGEADGGDTYRVTFTRQRRRLTWK